MHKDIPVVVIQQDDRECAAIEKAKMKLGIVARDMQWSVVYDDGYEMIVRVTRSGN